jgi:hypothetical protein
MITDLNDRSWHKPVGRIGDQRVRAKRGPMTGSGVIRRPAALYLKAPEATRRYTRIHFIQPLKERIVREVGYGLSLEGASSAALMRSRVKSEAA